MRNVQQVDNYQASNHTRVHSLLLLNSQRASYAVQSVAQSQQTDQVHRNVDRPDPHVERVNR